jgi:hypothetical protein
MPEVKRIAKDEAILETPFARQVTLSTIPRFKLQLIPETPVGKQPAPVTSLSSHRHIIVHQGYN